MVSVRAIYQNGQLRLLEPIDLQDGQEIQVQIVSQPSKLLEAISDLIFSLQEDEVNRPPFDETAVQNELDLALQGKRPLSELIIEERH